MKTPLVLSSLLLYAMVGCKTNPAPTPAPAQEAEPVQSEIAPAPRFHGPPQPKFGWKEFRAETFETHPLHAAQSERQFLVPGKTSRLRVRVNASSAIVGGVVPAEVILGLRMPRKDHRATDFGQLPCALRGVTKGSVICDIDESKRVAYVVRDARAARTEPVGIEHGRARGQRSMEPATVPDEITITLSAWQCIENCKKS